MGKSTRLSKSRYNTGLQCLRALYLSVNEPVAPSASLQRIFDQGTEVGETARERFPNGKLIIADYLHSREAVTETVAAIAEGASVIFEAAFAFGDVLVRIDILQKVRDDHWNIIEVKSSSSLKEEHLPDIAIQRYVAEGAGVKISKTFLSHLNSNCIFPDLQNLFTDVDCTSEVSALMPSIPDQLKGMFAVLAEDFAPHTEIGPHCDAPYECAFKDRCWSHVPPHSVFELNGVFTKTKFELFRAGIVSIKDVPLAQKVSRAKPQQLAAVRTGEPVFDLSGITGFLNQLRYPVYYLDFETFNPAIPRFVGTKPYAQIPFQYSCHIRNHQDSELNHFEFLASGDGDPRSDFTASLIKCIGKSGTVLAYNASFEKTRIKELSELFPSHREDLLALTSRFLDPRDVFAKFFYHPDFRGSLSLKDVLPVLVPEMTYSDLDIASGDDAMAAYFAICDALTPEADKVAHRNALLKYCKQDTLAMVELMKWLTSFARRPATKNS